VRAAIAAGVRPSDIRPQPTRRPLWIASGALLAAAAGIALYLTSGDSRAPSIAMYVNRHDHEYRDITSARIGDTIVIRADAAAAFRVYSNGSQLARCPGHAGCRRGSRGIELAVPLAAAGTVSAIAFTPALPDPEPRWQPSAADLDKDLSLATSMQIAMVMSASIEVR
jgi:hypothetical protein